MEMDPVQAGSSRGVQPGDWFVVDPGAELFGWIERGEAIAQFLEHHTWPKDFKWGHAGVASRWVDAGSGPPGARTLMIVQAEPGGAEEVPWAWGRRPHMWSTGTGLSVPAMGPAAMTLKGRPYSFIDYAAISTHALGFNVPGLRDRIQTSEHLICSQLVDVAAQLCAVHLFDDNRWNGYVTPLDLALLLISLRVPVMGLAA